MKPPYVLSYTMPCQVCGGREECDLKPGDYVHITAWGNLNGTPPRLDKLPTGLPGKITRREGPELDAEDNPLPGEFVYRVNFPGYGVLLVKGSEMMHAEGG